MDSGKHTFWNLHRHLKRKPDEDLFQQILRLDAKREVQAPTIEVIDLDTPKIEVQPSLTLDLDFNQEESQQEESQQSSEQEQYTQEQSVQQEQYVQQVQEQEEQSFQLEEPMQQEQTLQQELPEQQSLDQTPKNLPDHISDNLPEDMETADAQAEAEAHRLRSEQEKEIDTIIDEKVRELEQLELGQQLEPRPLSANDKITEWMKSSDAISVSLFSSLVLEKILNFKNKTRKSRNKLGILIEKYS